MDSSRHKNGEGTAVTPATSGSRADDSDAVESLLAVLGNFLPLHARDPSVTFSGERSSGSAEQIPSVQDRYRVLVEQIPAIVFMAYLDGGISEAYVSPQVEQVLGFTREEWLEDPVRWYHQIHPDDRQRWSAEAAGIIINGDPLKSVYRVMARDGQIVWFRCEARLVRRPDGQPWFVHGVGFDITDLKRTEQALNEEIAERERLQRLELERQIARNQQIESRMAAIVESSEDAIISQNLEGMITSWNKSAELMFGYTAEEAVGRHITLIVPHDRLGEEAAIMGKLKRGERIDHFETLRMRKDGTTIDVSVAISSLKDGTGNVVGASKVARDITGRKRADEALRRSEDKFRLLAENLESQVLARTSELEQRNAEVLKQSEELRALSFRLLKAQDDERRHIARELHDSAGQTLAVLGMNLGELIGDIKNDAPDAAEHAEEIQNLILQLTQEVRTTSYLLHPPLLDESGLSSALAWYTEGLEQRSGLRIELNIANGVGRLPGDMELAVFRLVQECLTNVHRHSGSKTAAIRITRDVDDIRIEVRDEGRGMTPEKLAAIQSRGSGVGFKGMRERLRQFHGELSIESSSSGTRISVAIPAPKDASGSPA